MRSYLLVPAFALATLCPSRGAAQVTPAPQAGATQSRPQFQGVTLVRAATRTDSVRVDIRLWSIAPGVRVTALDLPLRGLMIVELRGGNVTTTIAGRRVVRRAGEIWTVPAGSTMSLETGDDMATLQTTVVGS